MSTSSHDDDGDHRGAKTISDMRSRQLQWLQGGRAGSIVVVQRARPGGGTEGAARLYTASWPA